MKTIWAELGKLHQPLSSLPVRDGGGREVNIARTITTPLVLTFASPECEGCKLLLLEQDKQYGVLQGRGVRVVVVMVVERFSSPAPQADPRVPPPSVRLNHCVPEMYYCSWEDLAKGKGKQSAGFPCTVVTDKEGRIRLSILGYGPYQVSKIRQTIGAILSIQEPLSNGKRHFQVVTCGSIKLSASIELQSELSMRILMGLHEGSTLGDIASAAGVDALELDERIAGLKRHKLVIEKDSRIVPGILCLADSDIGPLRSAADQLGQSITRILTDRWGKMSQAIAGLGVSRRFRPERIRFAVIGGHILDIGAFNVFYQRRSIVLPPPRSRGAYAWCVEGGASNYGRYGLHHGDVAGLFSFQTFGGEDERRRETLPDVHFEAQRGKRAARSALVRLLRSYEGYYRDQRQPITGEERSALVSLRYLDGEGMALAPIYDRDDQKAILGLVESVGGSIHEECRRNISLLRKTFTDSRCGSYASFSEFFCWYYHVITEVVMKELLTRGLLFSPPAGYEYWLVKEPIHAVFGRSGWAGMLERLWMPG